MNSSPFINKCVLLVEFLPLMKSVLLACIINGVILVGSVGSLPGWRARLMLAEFMIRDKAWFFWVWVTILKKKWVLALTKFVLKTLLENHLDPGALLFGRYSKCSWNSNIESVKSRATTCFSFSFGRFILLRNSVLAASGIYLSWIQSFITTFKILVYLNQF